MDGVKGSIIAVALIVYPFLIYTYIDMGDYLMAFCLIFAALFGFFHDDRCQYWFLMWVPALQRHWAIVQVKRDLDDIGEIPPYLLSQVHDERPELRELIKTLEDAQERLGYFKKTDVFIPYKYRYKYILNY